MTAPAGSGENRGTICESPRTGSADAWGAASAGRAAAAPRSLAPIDRFHQRISRRSLHGLRIALPATVRAKNIFCEARRNGREPAVHRHAPPNSPSPTRGDLERECWRLTWDGPASPRREAVPCLSDGGVVEGAESGHGYASARPAPNRSSCASGAFRSITHVSPIDCPPKSRRKLAAQQGHGMARRYP